ncbi:MAG: ParB/RepB/Spo0J family partition protein, partial [Clostridia bacterium]|nr:ParB/RepB/Spo0J family partition protein [Clostridia bacterium]
MAKKTGLGKGLDALFQDTIKEDEKIQEGESILKLKINEVEPNREQPRKHFDEEALEELAESIKTYGLIQPIIVTKKEKYYEIIAGERRWRACKKAGLKEVSVIVRDGDEKKNKAISLIENIQREDLNAVEKADGIKALMDEYKLTQQQVSEVLGKSRSAIANTVR